MAAASKLFYIELFEWLFIVFLDLVLDKLGDLLGLVVVSFDKYMAVLDGLI